MFLYLYTMSEAVKKPKSTSITETYKTGTVGLLDEIEKLCKDLPVTKNEWILNVLNKEYVRITRNGQPNQSGNIASQ